MNIFIGIFAGSVMLLVGSIAIDHGMSPWLATTVAVVFASPTLSFAGFKNPADWKRAGGSVAGMAALVVLLVLSINWLDHAPVPNSTIIVGFGRYIAAAVAASWAIVYVSRRHRLARNKARVARKMRQLPRDFPYLAS